MTRQEAIIFVGTLKTVIKDIPKYNGAGIDEALDMAIKALKQEPLTDTEQRIFLAAMGREEKICREVCADGDGVDLARACCEIKRKVKKALWK